MKQNCKICLGTGELQNHTTGKSSPCHHCGATGLVEVKEKTGCFPKGTKILTPFGLKCISEIKTGEFVMSYNFKTHKIENRVVLKARLYTNHRIWNIKFKGGQSLRTTSIHNFFCDGKWVKAKNLTEGSTIKIINKNQSSGFKTVQFSKPENTTEPVFQLIVDGNFNFFAEGIVAHSFCYFKNVRMFLWNFVGLFKTAKTPELLLTNP